MYVKPLLTAFVLSVILLAGIYIYFYGSVGQHQPYLIRDLTEKSDNIEDVYRLRLHAAYGDIESLDMLKKTLAVDGYDIRGHFNMAFYKEKSLTGCNVVWTVVWDADPLGIVQGIDGGVSHDCRSSGM